MNIKEFFKIFKSAVIAGLAIGLGGTVFLKVGGLAGAVLFSFGLLTVVHYKLHLYTGKSGYFDTKKDFGYLFSAVLLGNVVGCLLLACIENFSLAEQAQQIVNGRLEAGWKTNFLMAIPCGFIMTTAVEFGKKQQWLPLLFGVPLFIMCGFRHSIADAYYYSAAGPDAWNIPLLANWIWIVLGNFFGCNLYRAFNGLDTGDFKID